MSEPFNQPFQEALDYFRQKVTLPSEGWRDIEGRAHDRAFVVAGAKKDALLADLRAEIEKALRGETSLTEFRKNFDAIVAKNGWTGWTGEGSEAGRAWRTKVIYETNLKTAHAAGRYRQMTDPDIVKVYKFWRYRHAFYREPERARPEHRDIWNGTVLPWDDPWWQTHYPPNGWNCSCGVETLSEDDLDDEGIKPDRSPNITTRKMRDPKTGEMVDVPVGIDLGWDHAPGRDGARGIVPRELQRPLDPPIGPVKPQPMLPRLREDARPFGAEPLPRAVPPDEAVRSFLKSFGASWDEPALFRDAAGHALPISKHLFLDGEGRVKSTKRDRHLDLPRLAETLKDPDEIWLAWDKRRDTGRWQLVRRYLRTAPDQGGFGAFTWTDEGWQGTTAFAPDTDGYLEGQRIGALIYRRVEKK